MVRRNNRGNGQQTGGFRGGKRRASDQRAAEQPLRQRPRYDQQPSRADQWLQHQSNDNDRFNNSDNARQQFGGNRRNFNRKSFPPAYNSHNNNEGTSWRNLPPPTQPLMPFGNAGADSFSYPPPPTPPSFGRDRAAPRRQDGPQFQRNDRSHQRYESSSSPFSNRSRSRRPNRSHRPDRLHHPQTIDRKEPGEIVDLVSEEDVEAGGGGSTEMDEKKIVEERLRRELGLAPNQVPEYVLRMREMGPMAYPPALIDQHVRVNEALPFFGGTVENILPKRTIDADTLPAFRGFTHVRGNKVDPEFVRMMNKLADSDYKLSHQEAMERSGIEEFRQDDDQVLIEKRKSTEVTHFDIPQYEVGESSGYFVAAETKTMKHTLEGFADGIQPFEHSTPNEPTGFLQRMRDRLKKSTGAVASSTATAEASKSEVPGAGDAPMDVGDE